MAQTIIALKDLTDKAPAEATAAASSETCGPAQRALAARDYLALMANPGLLDPAVITGVVAPSSRGW